MIKVQKIHELTGHQAAIYSLNVLQDHQFLSAGGDGWVLQWDLQHPEKAKVIAKIDDRIFATAFDKKRQLLIIGNMSGGLHWVDLTQKKNPNNYQFHQKSIYDLQILHDHLYVTSGDGKLSKWSLDSHRILESIQLSHQNLRGISISPDQKTLAISASDQHLYFVDVDQFSYKNHIENGHQHSIFSSVYHPSNSTIFTGGRDAQLKSWDVDRMELKQTVPAHLYTINQLIHSYDEQWLVSASRDKTIKIWDMESLQLLKVIDRIKFGGHLGSVNDLIWLPKTNKLLSTGDDRTIMVWEIASL